MSELIKQREVVPTNAESLAFAISIAEAHSNQKAIFEDSNFGLNQLLAGRVADGKYLAYPIGTTTPVDTFRDGIFFASSLYGVPVNAPTKKLAGVEIPYEVQMAEKYAKELAQSPQGQTTDFNFLMNPGILVRTKTVFHPGNHRFEIKLVIEPLGDEKQTEAKAQRRKLEVLQQIGKDTKLELAISTLIGQINKKRKTGGVRAPLSPEDLSIRYFFPLLWPATVTHSEIVETVLGKGKKPKYNCDHGATEDGRLIFSSPEVITTILIHDQAKRGIEVKISPSMKLVIDTIYPIGSQKKVLKDLGRPNLLLSH